MAKREYEHVGSVKHDVYRQKQKKTDWSAVGGFFVIAFILLMIFG